MTDNASTLFLSVLLYSAGLVVLYWVVRLAVRHARRDPKRPSWLNAGRPKDSDPRSG